MSDIDLFAYDDTRLPGYYWCKGIGGWMIAEWTGTGWRTTIEGESLEYQDDSWELIDENKLYNPDETAYEN